MALRDLVALKGVVRSSWSYARAIKAFVAVWLFYFNTQAVSAAPAVRMEIKGDTKLPAQGTLVVSEPRNAGVSKSYSLKSAVFTPRGLCSPGLEFGLNWESVGMMLLLGRMKQKMPGAGGDGRRPLVCRPAPAPTCPHVGGDTASPGLPGLREVTLWLLSLPLSNQPGRRARISHPSEAHPWGGQAFCRAGPTCPYPSEPGAGTG